MNSRRSKSEFRPLPRIQNGRAAHFVGTVLSRMKIEEREEEGRGPFFQNFKRRTTRPVQRRRRLLFRDFWCLSCSIDPKDRFISLPSGYYWLFPLPKRKEGSRFRFPFIPKWWKTQIELKRKITGSLKFEIRVALCFPICSRRDFFFSSQLPVLQLILLCSQRPDKLPILSHRSPTHRMSRKIQSNSTFVPIIRTFQFQGITFRHWGVG